MCCVARVAADGWCAVAQMSREEAAGTLRLAREHGLCDAQVAGLMIGCPVHGNAGMDFDDAGVFCHPCDRAARARRCGGAVA